MQQMKPSLRFPPMTPASSSPFVPGCSRRRFLQRSLFATGASVLGFPAVVSSKSPNSKLNIAFIATGGRGGAHVAEAKKMTELLDVVALCDVNSKNLEYVAASYPQARTYKDYRELHT